MTLFLFYFSWKYWTKSHELGITRQHLQNQDFCALSRPPQLKNSTVVEFIRQQISHVDKKQILLILGTDLTSISNQFINKKLNTLMKKCCPLSKSKHKKKKTGPKPLMLSWIGRPT